MRPETHLAAGVRRGGRGCARSQARRGPGRDRSWRSCPAALRLTNASRAAGRNARPAAVVAIPRPHGATSGAPIASARRCMTALTVGCGTPSRSAARRTCCSSKTVTAMTSSGLINRNHSISGSNTSKSLLE
jgi:hypothetical protein